MVIRLLPAPAELPEVTGVAAASTSLATTSPVTVTTRLHASGVGSPGDAYVWSTKSGQDASRAYTTPLKGSQSKDASGTTGNVDSEYVSTTSWGTNALSPAAQYLTYAAMSTHQTGQLIDVYA